MGKTCSVSEAREYDKGQQLPGLTGKVKVVFNPREKESSAQPGTTYQEQGIVLSDITNPRDEIVVSFYDHAAYDKSIVGKVMIITPGPKGGLKSNGSYEKQGNNGQVQINYTAGASKACDVTFGGGAAPANPQGSSSKYPPQVTGNVAPTPPRQQAQSLSWEDYLATEESIVNRCVQAACRIASANQEGIAALCGTGFEPAQIAAIASGLRMGAMTAGLTIDSPTRNQKAAPKPAPRAAVEPEDPGPQDDPEDDIPH